MNEEDYSSDTSDEDYVPEEAKDLSEDDDDDAEPCNELDETVEGDEPKGKKGTRKKKKKENSRKNPLLVSIEEPESKEKEENEASVDDKKKEESLWADFLADVDDKPEESKPKSKNTWAALLDPKKKNMSPSSSSSTELSKTETSKSVTKPSQNSSNPEKVKITKIFEFAGEEVRVEEEVDAESVEAKKAAQISETKSTTNKSQTLGTKRPLGLSSVVSLLDNKKKKLTTLEKTKIDWINYKSTEGIQEEMQNHLKSKDGYLEKKEFLERADLRQFEIERNMRMSKRNNR